MRTAKVCNVPRCRLWVNLRGVWGIGSELSKAREAWTSPNCAEKGVIRFGYNFAVEHMQKPD